MNLKLYTCQGLLKGKPCGNEFSSKKDAKSKKIADRPRCSNCGTRV